MAFANTTIWHNWSTGATSNGGGFDPANANFATDLTTDTNTGNTASPVVSSASYNFAAGDVGTDATNAATLRSTWGVLVDACVRPLNG